jgi:hypothetical protein
MTNYLTFDDIVKIINTNSENPAIQINMPKYRETHPVLQLDKEKYLEKILAEFNCDENILYTSMRNIIMHPSLRIINIEEFFIKLYIVFDNFIIKMNEILSTNKKSNFYFYGLSVNSSNFWLCLLFVKYLLQNKYSHLYSHIFIVSINNNIIFEDDYENYFITLDDCSYSGKLLLKPISDVILKGNYNGIICVLPFISSIAYKLIRDQGVIIIYDEIILSMNDDEDLKNTIIDNTVILKSESGYYLFSNYMLHDIQSTNLPIIFEHKIADSYSIPQFFYNFGTTYPFIPPNTKFYLINEEGKKNIKENFDLLYNLSDYTEYHIEHIPIKPIEQDLDYVYKRNPLLKFCQNETYKTEINKLISKKFDYKNEKLCVGAIYKNNPIILSDDSRKNIETKKGFNNKYIKYLKYKNKYLNLKKK